MIQFHFHNEAAGKVYETAVRSKLRSRAEVVIPIFKLAECGDDIARTIFVEQFPPRVFAPAGLSGRFGSVVSLCG